MSLSEDGTSALQYSTTEGYLPLREFIAERYRKRTGLTISPENILITNGSQQCLDLIGKVFIDPGMIRWPLKDRDTWERSRPSHSMNLNSTKCRLLEDGPDTEVLSQVLDTYSPKLFYGDP